MLLAETCYDWGLQAEWLPDSEARQAFLNTLRTGGPPLIDVYDATAWSCIIPLSARSLAEGSTVQQIPDFTGGKWETRSA